MFDEDFFDDFSPTEPFSQAEFVVHNNRQLNNLDAGRNDNDPDRVKCPDCGSMVGIPEDNVFATCRNCGYEFCVD